MRVTSEETAALRDRARIAIAPRRARAVCRADGIGCRARPVLRPRGHAYHPLTASDVGLRQYDRVFANDIGADYRDGLRALCGRYRQICAASIARR